MTNEHEHAGPDSFGAPDPEPKCYREWHPCECLECRCPEMAPRGGEDDDGICRNCSSGRHLGVRED